MRAAIRRQCHSSASVVRSVFRTHPHILIKAIDQTRGGSISVRDSAVGFNPRLVSHLSRSWKRIGRCLTTIWDHAYLLPSKLYIAVLSHCSGVVPILERKMTTLLSLPKELQAAIRLSATNLRLHNIWVDNLDTITLGVLEHQIDGFEEAVNLATTQIYLDRQSFDQNVTEQPPASTESPGQSMRALLPKIWCNAQLASDVCEDYRTTINARPASDLQRTLLLVSLPCAYYLLR